MSRILSIGTFSPPFQISQEITEKYIRSLFKDHYEDIDRLLKIFQNGQIKKRNFSVPVEFFSKERKLKERNDLFIRYATDFGCKAIENCLQKPIFLKKPLPPEEIDAIFFITSTGISTPSIETKIINTLPFLPTTKRIPLWGLGCAGGGAGLARAHEYCLAYPKAKVLVLSVELCSLTFQPDDLSKSNIIGTSLFSDGVAAVLMVGNDVDFKHYSKLASLPTIKTTQSNLKPNSEDIMGWDIRDNGFYVIFSKSIPKIIKEWLKPVVENFLAKNQLNLHDIDHFVAHPGGKKVLDAYCDSLDISNSKLEIPWNVLQNYGNMSSATILYVLKEFMLQKIKKGDLGLAAALGPGFSSELLLLEWS